jgi:hypothetical protein
MFQPRRAGKKGALAKGAAKGSAKVDNNAHGLLF